MSDDRDARPLQTFGRRAHPPRPVPATTAVVRECCARRDSPAVTAVTHRVRQYKSGPAPSLLPVRVTAGTRLPFSRVHRKPRTRARAHTHTVRSYTRPDNQHHVVRRGAVGVRLGRGHRQPADRQRVEPAPVRRAVQLPERRLVQARSHRVHRDRSR